MYPAAGFLEDIIRLSERSQYPFYVYHTTGVREKCRAFLQIPYPEKSVHYATMAGIHPELLAVIRQEKLRVFVNSVMHLDEVIAAGFRSRDIVYTASGMTEEMMKKAGKENVRLNLDSPAQFALWKRVFPGKAAGIRCNIGDKVNPRKTLAGYFIGNESRLGFSQEEIEALRGDPDVDCLHLYAGTDILDLRYLMECYEALAAWSGWFPNLRTLNFGGGFGIDNNGRATFPLDEYGKKITLLMEKVSGENGKTLEMLLEPGRIITGESGYFVTRVTDVKWRPEVCFIGINASTVQFPRPLFYPDTAIHPVYLFRDGVACSGNSVRNSTIYGCSTYSRDFFIRNLQLPEVRVGDLVIFGNAGAYCATACTRFLGFSQPDEYFL